MQNPRAKGLSRFISAVLVLAMVLSVVPPFELPVFAAGGQTHTFNSGAVYIDSSFNGDTVYILNGVFSVTVNGAQNVNLIFGERTATGANGVTIDRRPDADIGNDSVEDQIIRANQIGSNANATLYTISQQLASVYGNDAAGKAQTCPLLITGNSTVTATFHGKCRFYAGTNASTVSNTGVYNPQQRYNNNYGNGFAGIQVDSGSTFTIAGADDLKVFGSHQFGIPGDDGMATINGYTVKYSEVLRANASIGDHTNPNIGQYNAPSTATHHHYSGGAGIGGGATLITTRSGTSSFTNGTPGNIIINGGNIEVYGGHQAAGIGGAVNSPATSGMIQINGGNIVVHGGRWAAGIGDGDSVAKSNNNNEDISDMFEEVTSLIEINGGNVEVYGGVASSGIGTTDEISDSKGVNANFVRDMHINLNGGVIRAYSGFPDNFNGNSYPTEAPAAIGAGGKSLTPANSVYVSADADLRSAGFGNYALTEDGKNANTVPTIAVDSDGYLLLLRTSENNNSNSDQFHSTKNRTLTLYAPIKVEYDEIIWTVYIDQQHNKRYLVNDDGAVLEEVTDSSDGDVQMYGTNWNYVESGTLPKTLTLYVNTPTVDEKASPYYDSDFPSSKILETVEMAYYFRSIALTLPHPDEYGGIYALGIPIDGIDANDIKDENGNVIRDPQFDQISLTVEATQQGTQSGWIDFPSGNNMQKDNTAAPFIDLDVNGNATIDGLIGNSFQPNAYAYTVYAEPGTTSVDIYFAFEQQKNTNGTNVTHKIDFNGTILRNNNNGANSFTQNVKLTGTETVVRIKKTDGGNTLGTISYKITIIVKNDYTLVFNDPGKEYDGNPATVIATGAGIAQSSVGEKREIRKQTETPLPASVTTTGENYTHSYANNTVYIRNNYYVVLSYSTHVVHTSDSIYYFLKMEERTKANYSSNLSDLGTKYVTGWKISRSNYSQIDRVTSSPGNSIFNSAGYNWITGTSVTIASGGSGGSKASIIMEVSSNGATLTNSNSNLDGSIISIGTPKASSSPYSDREDALSDAEKDVAAGKNSGTYEYEEYEVSQYTQNIVEATFALNRQYNGTTRTAVNNNNYSLGSTKSYTEKGYYYIDYTPPSGDVTVTPVDIPEGDLEKVSYTYYQTLDAYGQPLKDSDDNVIEKRKLDDDELPIDAGTYYVEATLTTQTYNASGTSKPFVITRRPITVLRIENWLLYVDTAPAGDTLAIGTPGYIELDNVIPNDKGKVTLNPGTVYYDDKDSNTLAVDYKSDKIVIANGVLKGDEAHNYYLDHADPTHIRVYGQIAYKISGAIFRKDNDTNWRKYYPVTDANPVNQETADYHSPDTDIGGKLVYLTHAEYIRARTVNQGSDEARYCIDIEYGAMSFGFYRSYWDVNDLEYHELAASYWAGMDGSNNKLTVINRSNRPISYTLTLERASGVSGSRLGFEIKTTNVQTGGTVLVGLTDDSKTQATGSPIVVDAATAGANPGDTGTAATDSCYLIMSKVPQFAEGVVTTTGTISITFAPVS